MLKTLWHLSKKLCHQSKKRRKKSSKNRYMICKPWVFFLTISTISLLWKRTSCFCILTTLIWNMGCLTSFCSPLSHAWIIVCICTDSIPIQLYLLLGDIHSFTLSCVQDHCWPVEGGRICPKTCWRGASGCPMYCKGVVRIHESHE